MCNRIPQTEKPDTDLPEAGMVITSGYYYNCMFYQELVPELTKFGKGGNISGVLFRKEDEPDHWIVRYRVRHYRDDRTFAHNDESTWCAFDKHGDEAQARGDLERWLTFGKEKFGLSSFDFIEVHGDVNQFFACAMMANKPWFNFRMNNQNPENQ